VTSPAGLVLAGGAGRRFGAAKAPVVVDGERLVDRAVRVLREGGCGPVWVVLGAWVGEVPAAEVVVNPGWESGMGSSLRVGLGALAAHGDVERALVTLVDLPGLTSAAVARLVACPAELAVATYDGRRGHPVALARSSWPGVAESATGDRGARQYLASHSVTLVEVGDVATGEDLDRPRCDAP
jgi:CTP:molybdopterin cytidylyltransferase MocA